MVMNELQETLDNNDFEFQCYADDITIYWSEEIHKIRQTTNDTINFVAKWCKKVNLYRDH